MDSGELDERVNRINDEIAPQIDCTACGACCKTLMINVTAGEATRLAGHLQLATGAFEEKYIEKSMEGQRIMKSMPCSFLCGTTCSIYEQRFNECREFPHLHRTNFKGRLFGTLVHYAICPIIYNVMEELKTETGFKI
jgi:Fe-S-cluster containining protein